MTDTNLLDAYDHGGPSDGSHLDDYSANSPEIVHFDDLDGLMDDYLVTLNPSPLPNQNRARGNSLSWSNYATEQNETNYPSERNNTTNYPSENNYTNYTSENNYTNYASESNAATTPLSNAVQHNYDHGQSPDSPDDWRLTNAVHMEVQENARIPLFNWNIDRSNSVVNPFLTGSLEAQQNESNANSTENSNKMVPSLEFFLSQDGKKGRASSNKSYANSGAQRYDQYDYRSIQTTDLSMPSLNSHPMSISNRETSISKINKIDEAKLAELTGGINPTPLSEIKRKHYPQTAATNSSTASNTMTFSKQTSSLDDKSYVPSSNEYIPDTQQNYKIEIMSEDTLMNTNGSTSKDAIKIAATIANQEYGNKTHTPTLSKVMNPGDKMFEAKHLQLQRNHPHHHHHMRSINLPAHVPAVTAAIQNASKQKSQYGFGTKHVVPAVPTTKKSSVSSKLTSAALHTRQNKKSVKKPSPSKVSKANYLVEMEVSQRPISTTGSVTSNPTSEAAYERKKARAKNARVLLNEAIDRLSVAINLAGTQSKQRGEQMELIRQEKQSIPSTLLPPVKLSIVSQKTTNGINTTGSNPGTDHNSICTNIKGVIQNCVDIADDAKKWDRPSFIGSSATMIQAMNSQCDSLMRELASCHAQNLILMKQHQHHLRLLAGATTNDSPHMKESCESRQDDDSGSVDMKNLKDNDSSASVAIKENNESPEKRRRLDSSVLNSTMSANLIAQHKNYNSLLMYEMEKAEIFGSLLHEKNAMERILSFLDLPTIVTCLLRISKGWKRGHYFDVEPLWQYVSTSRFGSFNVRQWLTKLEDTTEGTIEDYKKTLLGKRTNETMRNEKATISNMTLYKIMDADNVLPHFRRPERMVFLGETRLPGKVSAWTFFIERSNGETMRSVLRPPDLVSCNKKYAAPYTSMPVVQLWTIIQNTAIGHDEPIIIRDQKQIVDASTRRRKDEMNEIDWDVRLQKRVLNLDGSPYLGLPINEDQTNIPSSMGTKILCQLRLFDTIVIETNIHAKGCSTTSKFVQKSNYTKIIVQVPSMTTVPLVIPFPRDSSHMII